MDPVDASSEPVFVSSLLPTTQQQMDQLMDLLRSHSLPREPSHMRSVIASFADDLARYDAEIARSATSETLAKRLPHLNAGRNLLDKYSIGCRSVFAPIRRLPTEILTTIFALCAPESQPFYTSRNSSYSMKSGQERVAQLHLLRVAGVCLLWHKMVMGTPSLWADIEADYSDGGYWLATDDPFKKFEGFVQVSLERSANCSLTIAVRATHPASRQCLELLAKHSDRWRSADIWIHIQRIPSLRDVKGNLPLLQHLRLGGVGLQDIDIFENAPKLTLVELANVSDTPSKLPWKQLELLSYAWVHKTELLTDGLATMRHLPQDCLFMSRVHVTDLDFRIHTLSPVHSDIKWLRLALADNHSPDHSREALGEFLRSLTLPFLKALVLKAGFADRPVLWPRAYFPAFALSSCRTLTRLTLFEMIITAEELAECLSNLPTLVDLQIEDVPSWAGDTPDHVLVTDGLLRTLTWTPESSLTPRLKYFVCRSLLTFDDHVLLEFISSRIVPGQNVDGSFQVEIYFFPTTPDERDLDESVWEQIEKMCGEGDLAFVHGPLEES
ncbi:hypothetical protein C8R43DRAFT_298019 [Mycena crocata]|nr:hypothetical protein C8R43DRAFT_298019 [Mycena crocata]